MPLRFPRPLLTLTGIGLLSLPIWLFGIRCWQRPPQSNLEQPLFKGISYRREYRSTPRPLMLHFITVDLNAPGIRVLATPDTPSSESGEFKARTTSEFLNEFKLQLAINANFFFPFKEKTPWDYYPKSGDRVSAVGQAISNGTTYSSVEPSWSALCFLASQQAQIVSDGQCPTGTTQAVAGSNMLLSKGKINKILAGTADSDGLYSRTAVGIDQTGKKLWLVAIDDKQPLYSEGVTQEELAEILLKLGAYNALNLDGGGSTTLARATPTGAEILNSPVHTKIPMRERSVANHLGFFALPL